MNRAPLRVHSLCWITDKHSLLIHAGAHTSARLSSSKYVETQHNNYIMASRALERGQHSFASSVRPPLPCISEADAERTLASFESSFHRREHSSRYDKTQPGLNGKNAHINSSKAEKLALVMSGDVRSFLSSPVQAYWRQFIKALRVTKRTPVLFAFVAPHGHATSAARIDEERQILSAIEALGIEAHAIFPVGGRNGPPNWLPWQQSRYELVLKDTPFSEWPSPATTPSSAWQLLRRAVAYDTMLQYETLHRMVFAAVLMLRPDTILPPLTRSSSLRAMWRSDDVAVVVSDMFAALPRAVSDFYFQPMLATVFRSCGSGHAGDGDDAVETTLGNKNRHKLLGRIRAGEVEPLKSVVGNLALHGVAFAGYDFAAMRRVVGLEVAGVSHPFAPRTASAMPSGCSRLVLVRERDGSQVPPSACVHTARERTCLEKFEVSTRGNGSEHPFRSAPRMCVCTRFQANQTWTGWGGAYGTAGCKPDPQHEES